MSIPRKRPQRSSSRNLYANLKSAFLRFILRIVLAPISLVLTGVRKDSEAYHVLS